MIRELSAVPGDLPERMEVFFGPHGPLSRLPGFQYRPQQQIMARAIATALETSGHLLVEAGTGVGKSLAYLVPALTFAHEHQRKAVVATHTIHLQEQLLQKDIPLLQSIMPFQFKAALLKGRQNYICPARLQRTIASQDTLFAQDKKEELQRLLLWSQTSPDGTLSDLPFEVDPALWSEVCSETGVCSTRTCQQCGNCPYARARQAVQEADVIVLNHMLFFTLLSGQSERSEQPGYLFHRDFVIFDEAHRLEESASQLASIRVSYYSLNRLLLRLFNPRTSKGLLVTYNATHLTDVIRELLDENEAFFLRVREKAGIKVGHPEVRIKCAGLVDNTLTCRLSRLRQIILDLLPEPAPSEMEPTPAGLDAELRDCARQLLEHGRAIQDFLEHQHDDLVYWVAQAGKARAGLALNASPIDLSPILEHQLFRSEHSVILTSATLSVQRGSLDYFQKRLGAGAAQTLQLDSPFNYGQQMCVYLPKDLHPPSLEDEYLEDLDYWIRYFTALTQGRAFVLFTNYRHLQEMARRLQPFFDQQGWRLLAQGDQLSARRMIEAFRRDIHSVLFGTDSFWQGVDVPGEALSNVIITRLPFPVPNSPLVEARMERLESEGLEPFQHYSLPEAILKFRQGVGRLIRSETDSGIVVVLDSRIKSASYGLRFINSLPPCRIETPSREPAV